MISSIRENHFDLTLNYNQHLNTIFWTMEMFLHTGNMFPTSSNEKYVIRMINK